MILAADSTIAVALISAGAAIITGAMGLVGIVITTRRQAERAKTDQIIADLSGRLDRIEHQEGKQQ